MSGINIRIGADVTGFERGQRDAVSSAQRGAREIVVAYAATAPAIRAVGQSLAINMTALQLASGNVASTVSALGKTSLFEPLNTSATQGIAHIDTLEQKLAALPGPIVSIIDGFVAFQAAQTVWRAFNAALEDTEVRLARLKATQAAAMQLGTGTTFLTQVAAQAQQLGTSVEALTGMLEKAREASRVRIGEGKDAINESAIEARLRQNVLAGNLGADDVAPYKAATNQEGQIRAVLDLIEKLKASHRDLAANDLGRTFFGADFEAKTRQGIDLIGAFRNALDGAKAAGSGLAPTPEEIERAAELQRREEAIAAVIRDAIAPAVHDFNELSDLGKRQWIEWEERVAGWVKWLGEGYLKLREIAKSVRDMAADWGLIGRPEVPTGEREGDPLVVKVRARRKVPDQSNPLPSLSSAKTRGAASGAPDPDSVASVIRQLEKARDVAEAELKTVGLSNVEKEKAVSLAKAEAAARADVEKGVRASAALTADEVARATAAAEAMAKAKDRAKDMEQQLLANAEAARYFGSMMSDAIADAVLEGRSLSDILGNLTKMFSRGVLTALMTGQGPLASLLGTAPAASAGRDTVGGVAGMLMSSLGGGSAGTPAPGAQGPSLPSAGIFVEIGRLFGFADGGYTGGGGTHEPAGIVHRGEYVIPKVAVARIGLPTLEAMRRGVSGYAAGGLVGGGAMSSASGAANRAGIVRVDVSGARGNQEIMTMVQAGVAAGMTQVQTNVGRNINGIVANGQRRYLRA